jgi:hypothetical protein
MVGSNEAGNYVRDGVATGRVTQAGQVSVEEPKRDWARLITRLSASLGSTPQNESLPLQVEGWA